MEIFDDGTQSLLDADNIADFVCFRDFRYDSLENILMNHFFP